MTRPRVLVVVLCLAASLVLVACGRSELRFPGNPSADVRAGGQIFADKCSGCHTLNVAGTEGSAYNVRDRERTDGPNFNARKETTDAILYAIRNGGFSGAIMPENIVVGDDARKVAAFVAQYSGSQAAKPVTPGGQQGSDG